MDKGDAKSTSGLRHHAMKCWGSETVKSADGTKDLGAAHAILLKTKLHDGMITAVFERQGHLLIGGYHFYHINKATAYGSLCISPQSL